VIHQYYMHDALSLATSPVLQPAAGPAGRPATGKFTLHPGRICPSSWFSSHHLSS